MSITKHTLAIIVFLFWIFLSFLMVYIGEFQVEHGLTEEYYVDNVSGEMLNASSVRGVSFYSFSDLFIIGISGLPVWLDFLVFTPLTLLTIWLIAVFVRGD